MLFRAQNEARSKQDPSKSAFENSTCVVVELVLPARTSSSSGQLIELCWLKANLLPMLPKHTQLQNSTLAIQVPTPILSSEESPSNPGWFPDTFARDNFCGCMAGDGTISGLTSSNTIVPATPTTADKMKPGFDLSIRYHRTGFASASVRETCRVDCQGNFLCSISIRTRNDRGMNHSLLQRLCQQKRRCCEPLGSSRHQNLACQYHLLHWPRKMILSFERDWQTGWLALSILTKRSRSKAANFPALYLPIPRRPCSPMNVDQRRRSEPARAFGCREDAL